ncbi:hypothetical protein C5167_044384 [Papaver somniferum]|uniref:Uncharacterized protein n=1 Tax=Papaver somniferum TaxID=3469 RepID=A0A4Y7L8H4_PAPSO|nr:hypothetical protein C5167_044384 [Papaver somniferum]
MAVEDVLEENEEHVNGCMGKKILRTIYMIHRYTVDYSPQYLQGDKIMAAELQSDHRIDRDKH